MTRFKLAFAGLYLLVACATPGNHDRVPAGIPYAPSGNHGGAPALGQPPPVAGVREVAQPACPFLGGEPFGNTIYSVQQVLTDSLNWKHFAAGNDAPWLLREQSMLSKVLLADPELVKAMEKSGNIAFTEALRFAQTDASGNYGPRLSPDGEKVAAVLAAAQVMSKDPGCSEFIIQDSLKYFAGPNAGPNGPPLGQGLQKSSKVCGLRTRKIATASLTTNLRK